MLPAFYQEPAPSRPIDWPLPRRATRTALSWTQTRQPYHVDTPALVQRDWPLPRRPIYVMSLRTHLQAKPTFFVDLELPAAGADNTWTAQRSTAWTVKTRRTAWTVTPRKKWTVS